MTKLFLRSFALAIGVMIVPVSLQAAASADQKVISFGTLLDPAAQIKESQQVAKSLSNPSSPQWRAKGDQRRKYRFSNVNADVPYRVCVPANWDGKSALPLVMFLHGAGNDESSYLDQNNKQMVKLADQHGYILVSPLGYNGAYGTILRLPAVFGQPQEAEKMIAARTSDIERTQQLSEKDVINVLELVLNEYPVDRTSMFITGHSMGSGGTWYIGAKYKTYWAAMAPMSGPFVQETGYAWDSIRTMPVFMTEGTGAASLAGSRKLREWMNSHGFNLKYKEVNADHGGMVPLVLPDVFDFFDQCRKSVSVASSKRSASVRHVSEFSAQYHFPHSLKLKIPLEFYSSRGMVTIFDVYGRKQYAASLSDISGEAQINRIKLSPGTYRVWVKTDLRNTCTGFVVTR